MRAATLTDRISVKRTGKIEGSHKTGASEIKTAVPCLILASSPQSAAQRGMDLSQAYDLFADISAGLKTGDIVTDQNGRIFTIGGVRQQPGIYTKHIQCEANLRV